MVDAPQDGKTCRMVRDLDTQRRFNVAASRAKDQLWLFHSPTLNDLRMECLRYRLLEHCLNPSIEQSEIGDIDVNELRQLAKSVRRSKTNIPGKFDSWFEVDVSLRIAERGYRILPQYDMAGYKIDFMIEGMKGRLAVECDGDEIHGGLEQYIKDTERQRQLERCGLVFWRVKGGHFYRDPDAALMPLWEELENRKIYPKQRWEEERFKKEYSINNENNSSIASKDILPILGSDLEESYSPRKNRRDTIDHKVKKHPEKYSAKEIRTAIITVLKECPNHSCTAKSITSRVLKELNIKTRGNPRLEFERRVKRNIGVLKREGYVKEYKAKNMRLRLSMQDEQLRL